MILVEASDVSLFRHEVLRVAALASEPLTVASFRAAVAAHDRIARERVLVAASIVSPALLRTSNSVGKSEAPLTAMRFERAFEHERRRPAWASQLVLGLAMERHATRSPARPRALQGAPGARPPCIRMDDPLGVQSVPPCARAPGVENGAVFDSGRAVV